MIKEKVLKIEANNVRDLMVTDLVNFCFELGRGIKDQTAETLLGFTASKTLYFSHPRAWLAVVWKLQRMMARSGPPYKVLQESTWGKSVLNLYRA